MAKTKAAINPGRLLSVLLFFGGAAIVEIPIGLFGIKDD